MIEFASRLICESSEPASLCDISVLVEVPPDDAVFTGGLLTTPGPLSILRGDVAELETLLEAANPEQAGVIQRALTPARDLISGGLKRSPSYASELEEDSYAEICKMSKQGGDLGKKAKQMKKLIEQAARLKGKGY